MFLAYFEWQFIKSPKQLFLILKNILNYLYGLFSISYLLKTLFAPWKRDQIYIVNATLADKFKVFIDNLISRFMGFFIRSITIIAGIILLIIYNIVATIVFLGWIISPLIAVFLIYWGLTI